MMMDYIVMGAALFAGAFLEYVLPAWPAMGYAEAPLILSIVVYYALSRSRCLMFTAAAAGGILSDGLGAFPLGPSILCFCVVGAVAHNYRNIVFSGNWLTHMFFGASAGAGYAIMLFLLLAQAHPEFRRVSFQWVAIKTAGVGVLGSLLMPFVFKGMRSLDHMMGNIIMVNAE